jgi:hypothetical protein
MDSIYAMVFASHISKAVTTTFAVNVVPVIVAMFSPKTVVYVKDAINSTIIMNVSNV